MIKFLQTVCSQYLFHRNLLAYIYLIKFIFIQRVCQKDDKLNLTSQQLVQLDVTVLRGFGCDAVSIHWNANNHSLILPCFYLSVSTKLEVLIIYVGEKQK